MHYLPVHGSHGPAAARNAGWRAAHGPIIAFTDDDCIPDPGWLKAGVPAFVDGVAAVTGRVVVPLPPSPTDYERDAAGLENGRIRHGELLRPARRCSSEPAVSTNDSRQPGARTATCTSPCCTRAAGSSGLPPLVVVHPVRPAPWGVSLKQQRKSLFNALLYKKHPRLYRQRIRPWPPWEYYAIVWSRWRRPCGICAARQATLDRDRPGLVGRAHGAILPAPAASGPRVLPGTSLRNGRDLGADPTLVGLLAALRGLKFRVLFL